MRKHIGLPECLDSKGMESTREITCEWCGRIWQPKDQVTRHRICPNCKRLYWNKLRQIKKKRVISNDTVLMDTIFGVMFPESNERYHNEINGVSLHNALIDAVNPIIGKDSTNVRTVILERFGLIDGKLKTFKEVGQILNLSASRIRLILMSGLRRLCHPARSLQLRPYVK
jgi:hypothetical protein